MLVEDDTITLLLLLLLLLTASELLETVLSDVATLLVDDSSESLVLTMFELLEGVVEGAGTAELDATTAVVLGAGGTVVSGSVEVGELVL